MYKPHSYFIAALIFTYLMCTENATPKALFIFLHTCTKWFCYCRCFIMLLFFFLKKKRLSLGFIECIISQSCRPLLMCLEKIKRSHSLHKILARLVWLFKLRFENDPNASTINMNAIWCASFAQWNHTSRANWETTTEIIDC